MTSLYQAISDYVEENARIHKVSIRAVTQLVGVSRSGFKSWVNRKKSKQQQYKERVQIRIKEIYDKSKEIYGSPKITHILRQEGYKISQKTVSNYMREMGIKACYIKPWTKTTISKDFSTNLKNILKRDFNPKGPDAAWCTDITYIWTYTEGLQRPNSTTEGTDAPIKTALENWYNNNIGNNTTYASKVADGKYCNDRNVQSGQSWASAPSSTFYYAAYKRIYTDRAPSLSCASLDTYSLKVGLITADEVMYAGGLNTNNTSYYLYNGQNYWTMSPYFWSSSGWAYVFFVDLNGHLGLWNVNSTLTSVRPVINLKADTLFASGGTGTQSNPYVVS